MFDFIFRFSPDGVLFYQWDANRAKHTFSPQRSITRWSKQNRFRDFALKIFNKDIKFQVPISDEVGVDVTTELKVYLFNLAKSRRIDDFLIRVWAEFFKQYECHKHWDDVVFYPKIFKIYEIDDNVFNMKQFIYWFRRFEDVYNKTGQKVPWEYEDYYDWNPRWEWYYNVSYNHWGIEKTTPLYGVYMPQMIHEMFKEEEPLPSGKYLQRRQKDFIWNMGQINFLFASRRSWKSLLLQLIQFLMVKSERPVKWFKKMKINYFCQSQETFDDISEYMEAFAEAYWEPYVWRKSKSSLDYVTYVDWKEKVLWTVQFKSWLSIAKGLWWTPYAVIIDEASRQPEMVYTRALANARLNKALIFCLTTVNYEEERDWCYEEAMRAYFQAMEYEPMEDLIVRLWHKYKLDMVKSPKDIRKMWKRLEDLRKEFLEERKYSCSFYTIDDIEYISEAEKADAITQDSHKWDAFILAEYYSVFSDSKKVFNPHRLLVDVVPDMYDNIFFSYDQAEKWDNPALNIIWIKDYEMYCLDSIILWESFDIQIQQIKRLKEEWKYKIEGHTPIRLLVDVTSKQSDVSSIELRGLKVDCPFYWTNSNSIHHFDNRILKVSRNWLFKNAEECFDLMYIKFAPNLDVKNWIIEELDNIVMKDWAYKTKKKTDKDDQVCALLMNLYYIYNILGLKKTLFEKDEILVSDKKLSEEEIIELIKANRYNNLEEENNYSIINY